MFSSHNVLRHDRPQIVGAALTAWAVLVAARARRGLREPLGMLSNIEASSGKGGV